MRDPSSIVTLRRSLSAPCAMLSHVRTLSSNDFDELLHIEMVEAISSLANPRLRIPRVASLFPSFTACDPSGAAADQPLANSKGRDWEDSVDKPVLFDRLNAANSQISLLNRMSGHTLERCAELEQKNILLSRALKQALDENRQLREQVEQHIKKKKDRGRVN